MIDEDTKTRLQEYHKIQNYLSLAIESAMMRVAIMDKQKVRHTMSNAFVVKVGVQGIYCTFRCDCPKFDPKKKDDNGNPVRKDLEIYRFSKQSLRSGGLTAEEWSKLMSRCSKALERLKGGEE